MSFSPLPLKVHPQFTAPCNTATMATRHAVNGLRRPCLYHIYVVRAFPRPLQKTTFSRRHFSRQSVTSPFPVSDSVRQLSFLRFALGRMKVYSCHDDASRDRQSCRTPQFRTAISTTQDDYENGFDHRNSSPDRFYRSEFFKLRSSGLPDARPRDFLIWRLLGSCSNQ